MDICLRQCRRTQLNKDVERQIPPCRNQLSIVAFHIFYSLRACSPRRCRSRRERPPRGGDLGQSVRGFLQRAVEHHRYRSELLSAVEDREQRVDLFGSVETFAEHLRQFQVGHVARIGLDGYFGWGPAVAAVEQLRRGANPSGCRRLPVAHDLNERLDGLGGVLARKLGDGNDRFRPTPRISALAGLESATQGRDGFSRGSKHRLPLLAICFQGAVYQPERLPFDSWLRRGAPMLGQFTTEARYPLHTLIRFEQPQELIIPGAGG